MYSFSRPGDWATISRECAHCGHYEVWLDYNRGPYWMPPIFRGRDGKNVCERCFQARRDLPAEQLV